MSSARVMRKKDGTYIHTYSKKIKQKIIDEGGEEVVHVSGYNLSFTYPLEEQK